MRHIGVLAVAAGLLVAPRPALGSWSVVELEGHSFRRRSLAFDASGNPAIAYGDNDLHLARWDGASWVREEVDEKAAGPFPSLAFDPVTGRPVIAYGSGDLRVARHDGSVWRLAVVDGAAAVGSATGPYTSLALGPAGEAYIAYQDGIGRDLKVASEMPGPVWRVEVVDGIAGDAGEFAALALDGAGRPAVSYYDRSADELKLARWDGVGWQIEIVVAAAGAYGASAIAFDALGRPAIAFLGRVNQVKLARWDGSAWTVESIGPGYGSFVGLGFDGAGAPLVLHDSGADVLLARRAATWSVETIDAGDPWSASLHLDAAGRPAVAYAGPDSQEERFARFDGAGWALETVDVARDFGMSPSLAYDRAGEPAIAFSYLVEGHVAVARRTGATWRYEMVDDTFTLALGPSTRNSLAFAPDGTPTLSYPGPGFELRVARFDGAGWGHETVPGARGEYAALTFDGAGRPAISYFDGARFALGLARWDGAAWSTEIVDPAQVNGRWSAIATDPAGHPAMSYYDGTATALKLARWQGAGWSIETVDAADDVGKFSSLAFDPSGAPAIAYLDDTNDRLRFALWDGTAWQIEVVEDAARVYGEISLEFVGGAPAVAWLNNSSYDLMVARREATGWVKETVESEWSTGWGASLAVDPAGRPSVAFYAVPRELRFALQDGVVAPLAIHRGSAGALVPGWQAAHLPLGPGNDDETPPFPIAATAPASESDCLAAAGPLVLYRALDGAGNDLGNGLRAVRAAGGCVDLSFR